MNFADLGLSEKALQAVELLGYEQPTPVQEQAIPLGLEGGDIIAAAKTGTGKTAAFSLPGMDRTVRTSSKKAPRMVVITPTRELAFQIADVCAVIAPLMKLRTLAVVGGTSIDNQIARLRTGIDVLIATPGRLIDLMNQEAVRLDEVEILVLDEADRMLDMGFLPSVRTIVAATPETRQTLLFSATIDQSVRKQVDSLLNDPTVVQIAQVGETADTVTQYITRVPQTMKFDMLKATLNHYGHERVIVFARTRGRADSTCRRLKRLGYNAEALHSDRTQNQRKKALEHFAAGRTDILVATDVLARGIDVEGVSYVVNFDLPTMPEDYVHRIGRTGRAGADGFALSYVTPETESALRDIEKFIKMSIPVIEVEGFSLEAAAAEAADRANKAASRKDPEIAEVTKELKKKERRRRRAEARAAEAAQQAEEKVDKKSKAKKSKSASSSKSARPMKTSRAKYVMIESGAEASEARPASKGGAKKAANPKTMKASKKGPQSSGTKKGMSSKVAKVKGEVRAAGKNDQKPNAASGKAKKGSSSSRPSAKVDMRPGRSHRAQMARRRGGNA